MAKASGRFKIKKWERRQGQVEQKPDTTKPDNGQPPVNASHVHSNSEPPRS